MCVQVRGRESPQGIHLLVQGHCEVSCHTGLLKSSGHFIRILLRATVFFRLCDYLEMPTYPRGTTVIWWLQSRPVTVWTLLGGSTQDGNLHFGTLSQSRKVTEKTRDKTEVWEHLVATDRDLWSVYRHRYHVRGAVLEGMKESQTMAATPTLISMT